MSNDQNYPIILAHGIARFDFLLANLLRLLDHLGLDLGMQTDGVNYFKGIARHLRANGFDVHHSSVSFASRVEKRAEELSAEVTNVLRLRSSEKVHIIAQSMGGLDARHMIVGHGMEDRVASLTTIGTPHLGTSFADCAIANKGHDVIASLKNVLDLEGFEDLTIQSCAKFNESARNAEAKNGVVYHTYAGSEEKSAVFEPLQPSWEFIKEAEGDNDGLVSLTSQLWQAELVGEGVRKPIGQTTFPVQVDHLNEVGW